MKTVVFDENARPGGQLFKQIHKFFGSKEHRAKVRGFRIGQMLLEEADKAGVEVKLGATVIGIYQDKEVVVRIGIPFYLPYTIKEAEETDHVTGVVIREG